jgi:hypothetical protein
MVARKPALWPVKKKKTPTLAENGSPNSTLFVNTHTAGKVCAVIDKDGDSAADEVITIAQGLTCLKEQLLGMETSIWLKYTASSNSLALKNICQRSKNLCRGEKFKTGWI